ncbi:DUF4179 domain-containing protein [Brevibacillus ruminantium]|uniref:DUF4179 domain-containing protein n=1 Tax=Brevibacillus ruminantium TaxID=2950604 RepID=A0ABY4WL66_9BACL|nr:DUF4179 domain-containing protein [Brevibacillus ruminantium]USG66109.1 DUF4179 domain-containing protein [Brevibacillus ruminantium]
MKCLTQEKLIAYMEDRLSAVNKQKLESHLDHCSFCQKQLEQWIDHLEETVDTSWENSLSEDLDQKIISTLSPHPVRVLNRAKPIPTTSLWKKRSITIMKRMTFAAAALTVAVSSGMLISPTFASYVSAAFTSSPIDKSAPVASVSQDIWQMASDIGIRKAAQNGFAQPVYESTTDQGITFEIKEVVADPLRISILASVKDENGKPLEIFWQDMFARTDQEPIFTIKDKQGNILLPAHPSDTRKESIRTPNEDWDSARNTDGFLFLNRELRSYFDDLSKIPDELLIEFHIKKMDDTKGNWKLTVPVDMKKAKAATKTHEINKSYTTAQGLKLDVKQITFAPSGVEMVIDRSNTENNRRKDYSYELVDDRGTVLGAWDSKEMMGKASKQRNVIDRLKWRHSLPMENGSRDFHYFQPIDESTPISFRLGSVYTEESAAFRATLDLDRIEKAPVTAEDQGDRFTFKKYVKEDNRVVDAEGFDDGVYSVNADGTTTKLEGYHLAFEGTLGEEAAAMFPFRAYWSIKDENGKKYDDVQYYIEQTDYKNGRAQFTGSLFVQNIEPLPKQLIITAAKRMVEHRNVDWEVPILSEK